jgi:hypothetical protein
MSLEELQRLQEFNVENIPIDHKDITETIAGVVFMMGQQLNELHKKVAEVVPVEALAKNWTRCQYPVHQHTLPTGDDEVVLVEWIKPNSINDELSLEYILNLLGSGRIYRDERGFFLAGRITLGLPQEAIEIIPASEIVELPNG